MMRSGVYAYRCRKPAARLSIPLLSRHWGYVGETLSFDLRHAQHLRGGGRHGTVAKSWADLDPRVYRLPLPGWKWLLRSVELLAILVLWPAYNVKGNRWNPRRIPLPAQRRQRAARDRRGWCTNFRPWHLVALTVAAFALIWWLA
jgi:hypothetical protein